MRSVFTLAGFFVLLQCILFSYHPALAGTKIYEFNNYTFSDSGFIPLKSTTLDENPPVENENNTDSVDQKVIISSGSNSLEFTPMSSFNNGVLIQPIKNANTGIPVAFLQNDTASWSFYTNNQLRLLLDGSGNIRASGNLLINGALPDNKSMIRVNGNARVDSAFYIQAESDTNTFISFHRNTINFNQTTDDGFSPYTTTPTNWALNQSNIPVLRIRHPLNASNKLWNNKSIERDFMILPYQYGMAIEYNGVVECWVGEWSIHKGLAYYDIEGKGNGWGGVLWVGDDVDRGGVRATARNNTEFGGNVAYGEISVEKFNGTPNGDFRFRLPSTDNQFQFLYGERGGTNIVAKLTDKGFFLPVVAAETLIPTPEKGQIYFDSTAANFKGYTGTQWVTLSGNTTVVNINNFVTGSVTQTSSIVDSVYKFPHGLGAVPSYYNVIATSKDAANISYVTADDTYIYVYYATPPPDGDNNLSWNWQAKI
jgi:hypothetical protein